MRRQDVLISRAAYHDDCDEEEYNLLRDKVLKEKSNNSRLPLFYDEGRKFLHDSFDLTFKET